MFIELQTFIEVVDAQSFTKAGELLNISQPTVSLHIKRLEEYFAEKFILRSKKQKKLIITPAGERLYHQAKKLQAEWSYTKKYVKNDLSFVAGRLQIGASLTIGEYFLPEFLGIFNKKYPYINVMVEMGNTTHMSDLLKAYKLDLAVVEGTVVSDKLEKEHLFRDKLVIIAPLDYKEKNWNENTRWIIREAGSGSRLQWEYLIGDSLTKFQYTPIVMNTNFAVKEAVKNGVGVALISEYIAKMAEAGNEVKILHQAVEGERFFDLLLPKNGLLDKVLEVFCYELKNFFKKKEVSSAKQ